MPSSDSGGRGAGVVVIPVEEPDGAGVVVSTGGLVVTVGDEEPDVEAGVVEAPGLVVGDDVVVVGFAAGFFVGVGVFVFVGVGVSVSTGTCPSSVILTS